MDYFYGIQARQYALHNEFGQNNLGSAVVASLNVPVWNWGATRSRIKQAEFKLQQARDDLSLTQRQLLANLNAFYLEANVASKPDSPRSSTRSIWPPRASSSRSCATRPERPRVLEVVDAQTTLPPRATRTTTDWPATAWRSPPCKLSRGPSSP